MLCRRGLVPLRRASGVCFRSLTDEASGSFEDREDPSGETQEDYPSDKYKRSEEMIQRFLRVDHAGEVGANDIYAGQMAVLGRSSVAPLIQHMWDQEKVHRAKMEELVGEHRVRPTVLLPIWRTAGFALGAGTALLGKEGAMACTVAVEDTIVTHYNDQIREIIAQGKENEYQELLHIIKKFRDEELEHHDTGLENDAELAPQYKLLSKVIKAGCSAAIKIAEKI